MVQSHQIIPWVRFWSVWLLCIFQTWTQAQRLMPPGFIPPPSKIIGGRAPPNALYRQYYIPKQRIGYHPVPHPLIIQHTRSRSRYLLPAGLAAMGALAAGAVGGAAVMGAVGNNKNKLDASANNINIATGTPGSGSSASSAASSASSPNTFNGLFTPSGLVNPAILGTRIDPMYPGLAGYPGIPIPLNGINPNLVHGLNPNPVNPLNDPMGDNLTPCSCVSGAVDSCPCAMETVDSTVNGSSTALTDPIPDATLVEDMA